AAGLPAPEPRTPRAGPPRGLQSPPARRPRLRSEIDHLLESGGHGRSLSGLTANRAAHRTRDQIRLIVAPLRDPLPRERNRDEGGVGRSGFQIVRHHSPCREAAEWNGEPPASVELQSVNQLAEPPRVRTVRRQRRER